MANTKKKLHPDIINAAAWRASLELGGALPKARKKMSLGSFIEDPANTNKIEAAGVATNLGLGVASGIVDATMPDETGTYNINEGKRTLQGGLNMASQGASIGSMFGPIGTGIGAGAGFLLGATTSAIGANKEQKALTNLWEDNVYGNQGTPKFDNEFRNGGNMDIIKYFANGGSMEDLMAQQGTSGMGDITELNGPSHEQGGIPMGENAEVEGGEVKVDDYIYSNSLTIPDTKKTFADQAKLIKNKYKDRPSTDGPSKRSRDRELVDLMTLNEVSRKQEEQRQAQIDEAMGVHMAKYGGHINLNDEGSLEINPAIMNDFSVDAETMGLTPIKYATELFKYGGSLNSRMKHAQGGFLEEGVDPGIDPATIEFMRKQGLHQLNNSYELGLPNIPTNLTEPLSNVYVPNQGLTQEQIAAKQVARDIKNTPNTSNINRTTFDPLSTNLTNLDYNKNSDILNINPNVNDVSLEDQYPFKVYDSPNIDNAREFNKEAFTPVNGYSQEDLMNKFPNGWDNYTPEEINQIMGESAQNTTSVTEGSTQGTNTPSEGGTYYDYLTSTGQASEEDLKAMENGVRGKGKLGAEEIGLIASSMPGIQNLLSSFNTKVTKFDRVNLDEISLAKQRQQTERDVTKARAITNANVRGSGRSASEVLSNLSTSNAALTDKKIGADLQSYLSEETTNKQIKNSEKTTNNQIAINEYIANEQNQNKSKELRALATSDLSNNIQGYTRDKKANAVNKAMNAQTLELLKNVTKDYTLKTDPKTGLISVVFKEPTETTTNTKK